MRPPGEHLEALDLPVREPHDRLVVDEDLAALERGLEVEPELPLGAKLFVQVRLVQRVRALRPLDAVHGDVRVADEVLAGGHARGAYGDADADMAGDVAAPERVRPVDLLEHAPRRRDRRLCVRLADEHGELVAADPGGEILRRGSQSPRRRANSARSSSPALCPHVSLTALKRSRSR